MTANMSVHQRLCCLLKLIVLVSGLCTFPLVQAEGALALRLLDQDGAPVSGAIISVTGAAQESVPARLKVMDQIDQTFVPHVLLVNAGDPVSFPNSDNIRHHVYSFSEPKVFEIKLYADRPEAPVVFDKPGLVVLGCNIHDSMLGYIYVSPTPYAAVSLADGSASLPVPDTFSGIQIWHEFYALDETEQLIFSRADLNRLSAGSGTLTLTVPLMRQEQAHPVEHGGGFGNQMRR